MSAPDNREEIKHFIHHTTNEFWNGVNVVAHKAMVLPHQAGAVVNKAEQEKRTADQRTKEALELTSLGSKSVAQPYYQRSRYETKFKILEENLCP